MDPTTYKVMSSLHIAIVAVKKHEVLHIPSVPVAVATQHAKRTRCIILSFAACSALQHFSTLFHIQLDFQGGKKILNIKCVLSFSL